MRVWDWERESLRLRLKEISIGFIFVKMKRKVCLEGSLEEAHMGEGGCKVTSSGGKVCVGGENK